MLEPLQQETIPTEEEVAVAEAEIVAVQEAVRTGTYQEVTGNPADDMQSKGPIAFIQPPLSVTQTTGEDEAISEEIKLVAVATAEAILSTTLVDSDSFELIGSLPFFTNATLEGFVTEVEGFEQQAQISLTGTLGPGYAAETVFAQSDIPPMGEDPTTINAVKGILSTSEDPQAGAFAGQFGGVSGTWRGLFFSIYAQRPEATGDVYEAGFLYGAPASSQDPLAIGDEGSFSAAGSLIRTGDYGTVQIPAPGAPDPLADALYRQFERGTTTSHVPNLATVVVVPSILELEHSAPVDRLTLTNGKLLEVWLEKSESGIYINDTEQNTWDADYGQTDTSGTYYILGSVSATDDQAGVIGVLDKGHVSISGNLTYLDQTHIGSILMEQRGTYSYGYGGYIHNYSTVTAGAFSKTPLAFSGEATGELTYLFGSEFVLIDSTPNAQELVGGIADTLFTGTPTAVTMMGSHDGYYLGDEPLLMYGSGWNILNGANGLISGGDGSGNFRGYMVGIWRDETIRSAMQLLYIDSDGSTGVLSGPAAGFYVPDLTMWRLDGTLAATPIGSTDVLPGDLSKPASIIPDHFKGTDYASTVGVGGFDVDGGGSLNARVAMGDPIRINDQKWGIWNAAFGGGYDGVTGNNWTVALGGQLDEAYDGTFLSDGFWVGNIFGSLWDDNDLAGLYLAEAITDTKLYTYVGEILGSHWETVESGDWQAAGIGTYIYEDLDFNGAWGGTSLYANNGSLSSIGTDTGKIGLIDRGSNTYDMTAIGTFSYDEAGGESYLWNSDVSGTETGSSGQFEGYTGGHWRLLEANPDNPDLGELDGDAFFLFITDNGELLPSEMGLMVGDVTGVYIETDDSGDDGFFIAESLMKEVPMASTTSAADYLPVEVSTDFNKVGGNVALTHIGASFQQFGPTSVIFPDQNWGVWESYFYGTGMNEDNWYLSLIDDNLPDGVRWVEVFGTRDSTTHELSGNAPGAWIDLEHAVTGVTGGEVKGTFDPTNWHAVALGSFMDTGKFMDMLATNKAALEKLNIPVVEIGRANLTQSSSTVADGSITGAYMNDVVFFDYNQGGVTPRIFATNDVGGNYSGTIWANDVVNLQGNGLAAQMTIDNFTPSGNWGARVQGGGTYSGTGTMNTQTIWMEGGAAGTAGTSTFSGTAAGVAGTGTNPYAPSVDSVSP